MTEYIEREAAKGELLSWAVCINHPEHLMREDVIYVLDTISAADVALVRHGRWIDAYPDIEPNPMLMYGICSECGFEQSISKYLNYCPNCGAKMDGGIDDD